MGLLSWLLLPRSGHERRHIGCASLCLPGSCAVAHASIDATPTT
jgi:hypothetical protein